MEEGSGRSVPRGSCRCHSHGVYCGGIGGGGGNLARTVEIDWREVDPYFSELSDCASFWTLINFTCDVIYAGLFVLFFIMGQDVESMFFEGLLNHINPILVYLILSLVINYGALRSLRSGREKCFLTFSLLKSFLFPVTASLLIFLIFFDVQQYFGTFWISFVAIVSCYNATAALCLWSMFTCNRYILLNEAAQNKIRKQQQLQLQSQSCRCQCPIPTVTPRAGTRVPSGALSENNQIFPASPLKRFGTPRPSNSRRVADCSLNSAKFQSFSPKAPSIGPCSSVHLQNYISDKLEIEDEDDDEYFHDVLSFPTDDEEDDEEEEVLQVSTVQQLMQEIKIVDAKNLNSEGIV